METLLLRNFMDKWKTVVNLPKRGQPTKIATKRIPSTHPGGHKLLKTIFKALLSTKNAKVLLTLAHQNKPILLILKTFNKIFCEPTRLNRNKINPITTKLTAIQRKNILQESLMVLMDHTYIFCCQLGNCKGKYKTFSL